MCFRALLMKEEALQKRRKEAEELLQWHKRLKEEEIKISELEQAANSIPQNIPDSPKILSGAQLNKFWKNITGSTTKKFDDRKKFAMSQKDLEKFFLDARKIFREVSDDQSRLSPKRKTSFTDYVSDFEIASSIKTLDNVLDSVSSSFVNDNLMTGSESDSKISVKNSIKTNSDLPLTQYSNKDNSEEKKSLTDLNKSISDNIIKIIKSEIGKITDSEKSDIKSDSTKDISTIKNDFEEKTNSLNSEIRGEIKIISKSQDLLTPKSVDTSKDISESIIASEIINHDPLQSLESRLSKIDSDSKILTENIHSTLENSPVVSQSDSESGSSLQFSVKNVEIKISDPISLEISVNVNSEAITKDIIEEIDDSESKLLQNRRTESQNINSSQKKDNSSQNTSHSDEILTRNEEISEHSKEKSNHFSHNEEIFNQIKDESTSKDIQTLSLQRSINTSKKTEKSYSNADILSQIEDKSTSKEDILTLSSKQGSNTSSKVEDLQKSSPTEDILSQIENKTISKEDIQTISSQQSNNSSKKTENLQKSSANEDILSQIENKTISKEDIQTISSQQSNNSSRNTENLIKSSPNEDILSQIENKTISNEDIQTLSSQQSINSSKNLLKSSINEDILSQIEDKTSKNDVQTLSTKQSIYSTKNLNNLQKSSSYEDILSQIEDKNTENIGMISSQNSINTSNIQSMLENSDISTQNTNSYISNEEIGTITSKNTVKSSKDTKSHKQLEDNLNMIKDKILSQVNSSKSLEEIDSKRTIVSSQLSDKISEEISSQNIEESLNLQETNLSSISNKTDLSLKQEDTSKEISLQNINENLSCPEIYSSSRSSKEQDKSSISSRNVENSKEYISSQEIEESSIHQTNLSSKGNEQETNYNISSKHEEISSPNIEESSTPKITLSSKSNEKSEISSTHEGTIQKEEISPKSTKSEQIENITYRSEPSPKSSEEKSIQEEIYNSEFETDLESNRSDLEVNLPNLDLNLGDLVSNSSTESVDTVKNSPDSKSSNENQISPESKSSENEVNHVGVSHIDVRKRVSEILADSTNVTPRGDKSPRLQDFYVTTYDIMSPSPNNSPEITSPTEEIDPKEKKNILSRKSFYGEEAEELLRKQLEIEQEIKRLEQQQKETAPYCFMREIPNKPPPPYKPPPVSLIPAVTTVIPSDPRQVKTYIQKATSILYDDYEKGKLSEKSHPNIGDRINSYKFVFDLCKEIALDLQQKINYENTGPSWMQLKPRLKPLEISKKITKEGLETISNRKVQQILGFITSNRKDNLIVRWSRKKRDHVDEILVLEAQTEESDWINYDKDELTVKNSLTDEILDMLVAETAQLMSEILNKKSKIDIL